MKRSSARWITTASLGGAVLAGTTLALSTLPVSAATDPIVDTWRTKGLVITITGSGSSFTGTVTKVVVPYDGTNTVCPREVGDVVWRGSLEDTTTTGGRRVITYTGSVLPKQYPPGMTVPDEPTQPTPPPPPSRAAADVPARPTSPPQPTPPAQPTPPPQPTPSASPTQPPEPSRPAQPSPPAALVAHCSTWGDADFTLRGTGDNRRLKVVAHQGGTDDEIFWARPTG